MPSVHILEVSTRSKTQLIDITGDVDRIVANCGISEGTCYLFVPHTTAAITINENADPTVAEDLLMELNRLVPMEHGYKHLEGNSAAHIKATLTGVSLSVMVNRGKLLLGTWQGIFFCEYDGPRRRKVLAKVVAE